MFLKIFPLDVSTKRIGCYSLLDAESRSGFDKINDFLSWGCGGVPCRGNGNRDCHVNEPRAPPSVEGSRSKAPAPYLMHKMNWHQCFLLASMLNAMICACRATAFATTAPSRRAARRPARAAPLRANYKSPDEENNYNDDAFGLVLLTGGVLSQDVDFAATFLALSAAAAVATRAGALAKDERAPAAVALLTLLAAPAVTALRATGSLGAVAPPLPVEAALCAASAVWAFANWWREQKAP